MRKASLTAMIICLAAGLILLAGCGEKKEPAESEQGPTTIEELEATSELQKVTVGDIEIAYRIYGQGDPLLMIMGFSGTMDIWDPDMILDLASDYQVIVFDNRGMGDTSSGTVEWSMEQFAEDTAGFMDALGIDRAHILAWSMGTNIAQELVLRHPEKVDRLILYAADPGGQEAIQPTDEVMGELTDTSGTEQERGERLIKLMLPLDWLQAHGEEMKEIFTGSMESSSPQSIARQAEAMMKWQGAYGRLAQIKRPTLLITGTADILTPPGNSLIMVEKIPGAWLVQLADGGHGAMYQYPGQFSSTVLDFLSAP